MESEIKFHARFVGNILVVGKTGCGMITFVQNLGLNRIFGEIKTVDWVSKIKISKGREDHLRRTFFYASVKFHYTKDLGKFDTLLETFRDKNEFEDDNSDVNSIAMGENRELDKLIVMEDVSGLADKSNE